jgi:hypothetical protein
MTMSMFERPRKASMAAEPVSPEVAPTMVHVAAARGEDMIHQPRQELHRHVLEGERRAVEELEHEVAGLQLDDRRHRRVPEGGIGVLDDLAQCRLGDLTAGEAGDDGVSHLGIGPVGEGRDFVARDLRPGLGQIKAAIGGQTGENGIGKAEHRGATARGKILHQGERMGWIGAQPIEIGAPGQVQDGRGRRVRRSQKTRRIGAIRAKPNQVMA